MDMPDRMSDDYASDSFSTAAAPRKPEPTTSGPAASTVVVKAGSKNVEPPSPRPLILHPVPALNWDGNWPLLASTLPVRGVTQQLAQQSELVKCDNGDNVIEFHVRVAVETLLSSGSLDKLAAALTEHFGKTVRMTSEIGIVEQTANAHLMAERAERQRQAEDTMQSDPFVLTLMREFGATIVPGSIKPIQSN